MNAITFSDMHRFKTEGVFMNIGKERGSHSTNLNFKGLMTAPYQTFMIRLDILFNLGMEKCSVKGKLPKTEQTHVSIFHLQPFSLIT